MSYHCISQCHWILLNVAATAVVILLVVVVVVVVVVVAAAACTFLSSRWPSPGITNDRLRILLRIR